MNLLPKGNLRKGSVLRKWLLSYLLILIIPLLGTLISYRYTRSAMIKEIHSSNHTALAGIMTGINDQLEQSKYTAESLLSNEKLTTVAHAQKNDSAFRSLLPDMIDLIFSFQRPMSNSEILVYLPATDYLITNSTANPLSRLSVTIQVMYGTTSDASSYARAFRNPPQFAGKYIFSGDYSYKNHSQDRIVYVRSTKIVPVQAGASSYATVYINTSFAQLASYFSSLEDGVILAFDENGQPLFHWGDLPADLSTLTLPESDETGTLTYTFDDQRYLGVSSRSDVCGWTFVLLRPEGSFWQSVNDVTMITMVFMTIALVAGLILTFFLLRHNYRPVSQTLRSIAPGYAGETTNEFDLIRDSYLTLMHVHQDTQHIIATQQETFRDSYLFSHLHGFSTHLPDSEIQSYLRLDFTDKHFAIISFLVGNERAPHEDAAAADSSDRAQSVSYVLDSLFTRAFVGSYTVYRLPKDQVYTWLVVLSGGQDTDFSEIAAEKLESIVQGLRESLNIPVSALLSDVLPGFHALPSAYQAILSYTQYQYITGAEGVVRVSSLPQSVAAAEGDEDLALLIEAISAGRAGDACMALSRLTAQQDTSAESGVWMFRLRACSWVLQILSHPDMKPRVKGKSPRRLLTGLFTAATPGAVSEQLKQLALFLCGESDPGEEEGRISQRVQSYINDHYADCNLCLSSIAEVFDLSPQYLSRLYRAETDGSLLDYISNVRVGHAKKLLERSDMTVSRAAELVGYTNVKTFRRAFTRYEGITPGKYEDAGV